MEIRVADICLYAEDAAFLAAVIRALVETSAREWRLGTAPPAVDTGMLRLSNWQASRFGVNEMLIGPLDGRPCPAARAVDELSSHVRRALEKSGDLMLALAGLADMLSRGTRERRQRQAFGRGITADIVAAIVSATQAGGRPDGDTATASEKEIDMRVAIDRRSRRKQTTQPVPESSTVSPMPWHLNKAETAPPIVRAKVRRLGEWTGEIARTQHSAAFRPRNRHGRRY